MKSLLVLSSVLVLSFAQRPGYLGSGPVGYPGLASRFKDDASSTSQTPNPTLNNRVGETQGTTQRIPVDARGDSALVDRLNQWPREHRPFWILNADHIERQRGGNNGVQGGQNNQFADPGFGARGSFDDFGNPVEARTILPVQTRGSFAGRVN